MSYKTDLQSNNVDLQEILNTINNLPEAENGTNIDTCTITIESPESECILYGKYWKVIDGVATEENFGGSNIFTLTDVMVNSNLILYTDNYIGIDDVFYSDGIYSTIYEREYTLNSCGINMCTVTGEGSILISPVIEQMPGI